MLRRHLIFVFATVLLIQTPVFADCVSTPWTGAGSTVTTPCSTVQAGVGSDLPGTPGTAFYAASTGGNMFFTARDSAADLEAVLGVSAPYGGVVGTRSNHDLYFQTNSNNLMILKSSGRLGIGVVPDPQNMLHVFTSGNADGLSVDGSNNPALNFRNTGVVKGYVGLATTPSGFFTGSLTNDLIIRSESNRILLGLGFGAPTVTLASGMVGIGTAPLSPLHINGITRGEDRFEVRRGGSDTIAAGSAFLLGEPAGDRVGIQLSATNNMDFWTWSVSDWFRRMTITSGGAVVVGGTTPINSGDKFSVYGDVSVSGNIAAKYQDVAEWVPATTAMPPGTVVVVGGDSANTVAPSEREYDTRVAGVISSQPGVILGVEGPSKTKVATTGRVLVRVDASRAPIKLGDLLVTSASRGVAMRSEPIDVGGIKIHRPGTLIGKALEPLESGEGEILVLLSLQ